MFEQVFELIVISQHEALNHAYVRLRLVKIFLVGVKHLNFQIPEGLVVAVVVVAQQCERERVQMINM